MTVETLHNLIMPLLAGAGLGLLYHAALWWTVSRLAGTQRPVLLIILSFYLRLGTLAAGFYLVMAGSFSRMLGVLAGFLAVRLLLVRKAGPPPAVARGFPEGSRAWK